MTPDGRRRSALVTGGSSGIEGTVSPSEMLTPHDVVAAVRLLLSLSPAAVVSQLVIERAGAGPLAP